jgi:hypothetical protein
MLPEFESQIGPRLQRIVAYAGYKGRNEIRRHKLKV